MAERRRYIARRRGPRPAAVDAWIVGPDGRESPLPHVVRHSYDGFEFGYGGSGPADLARSILLDFFGLHDAPERLPVSYQRFKWRFIATAGPHADRLEIGGEEIAAWVRSERRRGHPRWAEVASSAG